MASSTKKEKKVNAAPQKKKVAKKATSNSSLEALLEAWRKEKNPTRRGEKRRLYREAEAKG